MAKKRRCSKVNPQSLSNLKPGSEPAYGEVKKRRSIAVTDTGYEGLRSLAQASGCSVSEYLERLGRGILGVSDEAYEMCSAAAVLARLGEAHATRSLSESELLGKEADFKEYGDTPNPALVL